MNDKNNFKKSFLCLLTCFFLVLSITACDNLIPGSKNEDITLSYWVHNNFTYEHRAQLVAHEYSAENENITIKVEVLRDFWTDLYTSLAAGTCGDVVEMYGTTHRLAMNSLITSVPESVMSVGEIENTFFKSSLSNRKYEGLYYGLPGELNAETPGLLVNVNLLKSQGFEIPASWWLNDGPETWDELIYLARQLTVYQNDKMVQAGLGIVGGEEISMFLSLIWQLGGDFRDTANMRIYFDSPEAVIAAEFIMDLITGPGAVHSSDFRPRRQGFMEGVAAMTIASPWAAVILDREFEDFHYEYFNLPPFIAGSSPFFLGEGGWGPIVPATTADVTEAWKFVVYSVNEDNQLEFSKLTGNLPSHRSLRENEYFTTGAGKDVIGRAMKIADYGYDFGSFTPDPSILFWEAALNGFRVITTGRIPIPEGLAAMQNQANNMIEEFNGYAMLLTQP